MGEEYPILRYSYSRFCLIHPCWVDVEGLTCLKSVEERALSATGPWEIRYRYPFERELSGSMRIDNIGVSVKY
jgi:hypothetical protein